MSKQVVIEREECLGCESCVELCPEVFGFDVESGKAYVNQGENWELECVEESMSACPAACIKYEYD